MASQIHCTQCGERNEDKSRFCFACGSQLTSRPGAAGAERTATVAAAPLAVGETLGHYRITALLGRGGFGEVYRAKDENLGREVAIKVLPPELAADPERLQRFRREAQTVAGLNHPNIVTVHSIESGRGMHFLTMELMEGQRLRDLLDADGMEPERVVELALPLARALAAAHARGITHRDLKPDNVMLGADGSPKILDFGLAKIRPPAPKGSATQTLGEELTAEGVVLGTVHYMSPEQCQGRPADARADVFSFGVVLFQMLTGERPFQGRSAPEIMSAILHDETPLGMLAEARVPAELAEVVVGCLHKEPRDRYADGDALVRALEGARESTIEQPARVRTTRRGWLPWAVVSVVVVLAALGWRWLQDREPTPVPVAERQRVVVLPLENLGPPEDAYFAAGLTEEIINRLSTVGGLGVVSRTTAERYADTTKSIEEIGRELGVQYVLEGSVRWQKLPAGGGRIRVTSQLIEVADDTGIWSETYDRAIQDVFDVQADIATHVTEQLDVTLLAGERESIEVRPTENMLAYEAYLRGQEAAIRADRDDLGRVEIQMFSRAVELDSGFLDAWVALARTHSRVYASGRDRSHERRRAAREAIDRALELEPDSPLSFAALGYFHYWVDLSYEAAIDAFAVARKGLPGNNEIPAAMGYAARRAHDWEAAKRYLREAVELDPQDSFIYIEDGLNYTLLRDYGRARELFARSAEVEPEQWMAHFCLAENEWSWQGRLDVSRAHLTLVPVDADEIAAWAWWRQLAFEGDYGAAIRHLESVGFPLIRTWWLTYPKSLMIGLAHYWAGRPDEGRPHFEAARLELLDELTRVDAEDFMGEGKLRSALGLAYAGLGQKDDAVREGRLAAELHSYERDALADWRLHDLARIYAMTDEPQLAIEQLEFLMSVPSWMSPALARLDPTFVSLRDEPRYRELVER